ncbi:ZPR1 zinc-finger domain-containing protein [Flagelloscypha sp. PMI_526]|nr:ZPR1 zinc-finger domain-containing protein [Flagelloscypha sp. PMI_526]
MSKENEFFPSIGQVADQADHAQDNATANDDDRPVEEIESLCMRCHEQGMTRMLLTTIPYFKEVVVMSFRCEHCGFNNNEIQSAGTIRPEGALYVARILDRSDLDRQIVRSPYCEIQIPELELTLPSANQGQLTTVEGLVRDIATDLSMDQPLRKYQDEASYTAIQKIIDKLTDILGDEPDEPVVGKASQLEKDMPPFTLKLDDPSGNSFIEFIGSMADPKWNMRTYPRTKEHNILLGLSAPDDGQSTSVSEQTPGGENDPIDENDEEVFTFPGTCSSCGVPSDTKMKKVNIPHFQDIIIMSTNCERCGYRDNEVKSGSAISAKGKRIILKVEDKDDLARDILKSETAGFTIPEIELELTHGTLGGRFTTIEGILEQVYEELAEKTFYQGDSIRSEQDRPAFAVFLKNLKEIKAAEKPFTIILDDPLANSYIQNIYAPDPDPNMVFEHYDRTWQQNEDLGLNDIQVEGYHEDDGKGEGKKKLGTVEEEKKEEAVAVS